MATKAVDFIVIRPEANVGGAKVSVAQVADCVAETNRYIASVYELFERQRFDVFRILGQRNISGVIGEIFGRILCRHFYHLRPNPHPDGRPDLLFVGEANAQRYFDGCFHNASGKRVPLKSRLSPYRFGGAEVKATIGAQVSGYKRLLKQKVGQDSFEMGMPRIAYLGGLTYWAHHRHCTELIGLYYDYYESQKRRPQILGVFYAELVPDDWNVVSLGDSDHKKTSNTSLNKKGLAKVYNGCLVAIDNHFYLDRFKRIGIKL